MTYYLDIQQFGYMELFLIILMSLKYLFGFGWDSAFIRFYNQKNENKYSVASSTLISRLVLHLLLLVIFFFLSENILIILRIDVDYINVVWIILFIYILEDYFKFLILILRSENLAKSFGIFRIYQIVLQFILLVSFFVFLELNIHAVFYSLFLTNIIILLFIIIKYKKFIFLKQKINFYVNIKKLFAYGFPLLFVAIAFFVINYSDRYMLRFLLEDKIALQEIGLYSFYNKIASSCLMFLVVFRMIWMPLVLKNYHDLNYKKVFRYIIVFCATISLSASLFVSLFSFEILNIFSGDKIYLLKYNVLSLVFIIQLLILLGDYTSIGIHIMKKTTYSALFGFLFAIINIFLNYFLIPIYMLEGAIIASILSLLGYIVATNILSYKLYKLNFNFYHFLIGLILLSGMYFFSTIELTYKFYVLLFLILLFSFYIKINFANFKFCFLILKKDKVL